MLEHELRELRDKVDGGSASGPQAEGDGWGGRKSKQEVQEVVDAKERELEEVKATERVNAASKQALTSQV
jgi:hypothetical protein